MRELLEAELNADGLVPASPVNMGGVTAIFRRFLERFSPLGYWPWGTPAPKNRKGVREKRAVIVTSAGAPTLLWRVAGYTAEKALRYTAKLLNAKQVRALKYGLVSQEPTPTLTDSQRARARALGQWLASG